MRLATAGTEYSILERYDLDTRTVEGTDGEIGELVQALAAGRVLEHCTHYAAAQCCPG
jgi:hypothetical protein